MRPLRATGFYTERALYYRTEHLVTPTRQSSLRDEHVYELYIAMTSQSPNPQFRQKSVLTGKCFEQIDMGELELSGVRRFSL